MTSSSVTGGRRWLTTFIACDREQELLLPPSLREWLPGDHLAWFVLDAVDELDSSALYAAYREDGWGRAAFEPSTMVALFAVGVRARGALESRDRAAPPRGRRLSITANRVPDHATIARVRARHEQALAAAFTQVLALCAKAGLVLVGVVALDGSLLAGNFSPGATGSYASTARRSSGCSARPRKRTPPRIRYSATHAVTSCRPSSLTGARAGSGCAAARRSWSRSRPRRRLSTRPNLAGRAAWEREHGRRLADRKPTPADPAALTERRINTTDSDDTRR
jgi:transposase